VIRKWKIGESYGCRTTDVGDTCKVQQRTLSDSSINQNRIPGAHASNLLQAPLESWSGVQDRFASFTRSSLDRDCEALRILFAINSFGEPSGDWTR